MVTIAMVRNLIKEQMSLLDKYEYIIENDSDLTTQDKEALRKNSLTILSVLHRSDKTKCEQIRLQ